MPFFLQILRAWRSRWRSKNSLVISRPTSGIRTSDGSTWCERNGTSMTTVDSAGVERISRTLLVRSACMRRLTPFTQESFSLILSYPYSYSYYSYSISGAVRILRNAGDIDFKLLCSGKLCFDELKRVKRVSRASVKLPHFLDNIALYRYALKEMLYINGLQPIVILHSLRRKPIIQKEDTTKAMQRKRRTPALGSMEQNKTKLLHREELDTLELITDYGNYEMFSIQQLMPKLVL